MGIGTGNGVGGTCQKAPEDLTDTEIVELVEQAFDEGAIGTYGVMNPNGADSYHCPFCGESQDIQGHGSTGISDMSEVRHTDDCIGMRLKEAIEARAYRLREVSQAAATPTA